MRIDGTDFMSLKYV